MIVVRSFEPQNYNDLIALWNLCGVPARAGETENDLLTLARLHPDLFLLVFRHDQLIGSVLATYDGRRGWISHLSVHPDEQKRGVASQLLNKVEQELDVLGCQQINLLVDTDNDELQDWYSKRGYQTMSLTLMYKSSAT